MRRRQLGFKRKGDGRHQKRIRRPDPSTLHVNPTETNLTGVAGLAPFGAFIRELGVDAALSRSLSRLKTGRSVIYPMAAQMRLLMDSALAGEERVFGIEALAVDPLFVRLAGGVVPSIDTVYRDLCRFDEEALEALHSMVVDHGLDWDADGRPRRQVAEVPFRCSDWPDSVRVIAVRTRDRENGKQIYLWEGLDYTVQVFLTNEPVEAPEDVAARYDLRAGIEPLIGDLKHGWGCGRVPSHSFNANHAALLLKLLTANLMRRYVLDHVPHLASWRTPWLRRALILVPGRLARSARGTKLHVPERSQLARWLN
nr:transposase [Sorangium cellulosum]